MLHANNWQNFELCVLYFCNFIYLNDLFPIFVNLTKFVTYRMHNVRMCVYMY
jgi:hypothetical protein